MFHTYKMASSGPSEYEKKLIEMQYQMKFNNEGMKDYFSELDSWTKEMNEKEKTLLSDSDIIKKSNKVCVSIKVMFQNVHFVL